MEKITISFDVSEEIFMFLAGMVPTNWLMDGVWDERCKTGEAEILDDDISLAASEVFMTGYRFHSVQQPLSEAELSKLIAVLKYKGYDPDTFAELWRKKEQSDKVSLEPETVEEPEKAVPIHEVIEEWEVLNKEISDLVDRTQFDEENGGETVRMMLEVPKEWAILAAWLEIMGRRYCRGDMRPLGRPIDLKRADWCRAKTYIWRTINNHFHTELHYLCTRLHPFLYEKVAPEEEGHKLVGDIADFD